MKLTRPKMGVGAKTMAAFTLVFWIPLLILIFSLFMLFQKTLSDETASTSRIFIQSIEDIYYENPKLLKGILSNKVQDESVRDAFRRRNNAAIQKILLDLSKITPYPAVAIATDENFNILTDKNGYGNGRPLNIGTGLSDAIHTGHPVIATELVTREFLESEKITLYNQAGEGLGLFQFIIQPVNSEDKITGAIVLGILLTGDPGIANTVYSRLGVEMALFAGSHIESFRLHSSPSIPRKLWALGESIPDEIKNEITFGRSFSGEMENAAGLKFFAAFKPVKDNKDRIIGTLGLSLTGKEHRNEIITNLLLGTGITSFFGFFLALGLAYITHHDITHPLKLIQKAMDSFGEGLTDTRVNLETGDEFEKLGDGYNSMAEGIAKREARLRKHYEVAKLLMSTLDFDNLIVRILKIVLEVTESNMGIIYLVDEKKERLIPKAHIGTKKEVSELDLLEGYPGMAYEQKKYILINVDRSFTGEKIELGFTQATPTQTAFIPIIYDEDVMGVLVLGRLKDYSQEDTMLFEYLAGQISIALDNAILHKKVQELSITDNLTGLNNRLYLNRRMEETWSISQRYDQPMSVILGDLDNFKKINDNYGHDKGDEVLEAIGKIFKNTVRKEDITARYGGEEFVIILPNSDQEKAADLAKRLLEKTRELRFPWHEKGKITMSLGIASYPHPMIKDTSDLIRAADTAMYISKTEGKDRVTVYRAE